MSVLRFLKRFYRDICDAINNKKSPRESLLVTLSPFSNAIGLHKKSVDMNIGMTNGWMYHLYSYMIVAALVVHTLTIVLDVFDPEVYTDIALLGDDVCIILGVLLCLIKTICYHIYQNEIEHVGDVLSKYFNAVDTRSNAFNRKAVCWCYLQEVALLVFFAPAVFMLFLAISIGPIFESNKNLPFRAKVPYDVSSGWPLHLTYAFQVLSTFFLISHILFMDHNGQACMNECCLHLSILANELQTLDQNQATKSTKKRSMDSLASKQQLLSCIERHREMIIMADGINRAFETKLFVQFIGSLSIICLTAFEATSATDAMTCIKFIVYGVTCLMQIFVWCLVGNKTFYQSIALSDCAYNSQWYTKEEDYKQMIRFMIRIAQRPLYFRGGAFYVLNFETFLSVLSGSYSFYALLRTVQ